MSEWKEEIGMTDLQFKDHLRGVIADLERISEKGVSIEAGDEINRLIQRYRTSLED